MIYRLYIGTKSGWSTEYTSHFHHYIYCYNNRIILAWGGDFHLRRNIFLIKNVSKNSKFSARHHKKNCTKQKYTTQIFSIGSYIMCLIVSFYFIPISGFEKWYWALQKQKNLSGQDFQAITNFGQLKMCIAKNHTSGYIRELPASLYLW